LADSALLR